MFLSTGQTKAERKRLEQQVSEAWVPRLKDKMSTMRVKRNLNESDYTKLAMLCHARSINESGAATLDSTVGRGGVSLGNNPDNGLGGFYDTSKRGSGEVFTNLFGVFLESAAETVAMDFLPNIPMDRSSGTIYIAEPVYADGRLESASNKPLVVKVKATEEGSPNALVVGTEYTLTTDATYPSAGEQVVDVTYVGRHRLDGSYVFRIGAQYDNSGSSGTNWKDALVKDLFNFADDAAAIYTDASNYIKFDPDTVDYVEGFTNFIGGFSGAGANDSSAWFMNRGNGARYNSPMTRKVGERTHYRSMGVRTWSRNFSAETIHLDLEFTTEQVQDLEMDHGIQALDLADNILQDQLSQHMNDHILGRIFALGWQHHYNMNQIDGFNLNTHYDVSSNSASNSSFIGQDGSTLLTISGPAGVLPSSGAISENLSTLQRRLVTRLDYAASVINTRSRRGRGDHAVMNARLTTALRDVRGFTPAPFENDFNTGGLTFIGTFNGIRIYEDPLMELTDGRVAVWRKGSDDDSGLKICPYLLAEKISTIAEGTMAPKVALKSRYSIVEAGANPETSYLTVNITEADGYGIV
jgi:hypothetical protein